MTLVYLDYNATTPMDPRVMDAMRPWFLQPSNAGSRTHWFGQQAKKAVDVAREDVARAFGAAPEDVVFTSGATESNNLAILGIAEYGRRTGRTHVISTAIEHKAVLEPLHRLADNGFSIDLVPVTSDGCVCPVDIHRRLRPETLLVSVMHSNNETGVLQPIAEIGDLLKNSPTLFHVDAAQSFGKESGLRDVSFDFASVSGHKIYGPQGVGALCVRRNKIDRREISPLVAGGGQERGLRPGTVPVPLAIGLGKATELALAEVESRRKHAATLKAKFLEGLVSVDYQINGDPERTQPHVINISFPKVDSEALMMALRESVALSNGSACTSSLYAPSHVLKAMGLDEDRISSAVRISWGLGVDCLPTKAIVAAVASLQR